MKKSLLVIFALIIFAGINAQVTVGVTPYTTLKGAFDAINAGTHTGAITITIDASTIETSSAVLNASGVGSANYSSIHIYPTVSGLTISGNLNAPLIDLFGSDNVTIDGRLNATGSSRDLTITNTSPGVTASTIRFIESAQSNTVEYCFLKGASQNPNGGVLFFSTATVGTGNSNNTITNSTIKGVTTADADRPLNCIMSLGTATKENSNNTVSNNNFLNFDKVALSTNGININSNSSAWSITGNSFYQSASVVKTASGAKLTVININNTGINFVISGNYIGGTNSLCSGTQWTTTGAFSQQFFAIVVSAGSSSLQNNTIAKINWTSTNVNPFFGIRINAGTFDVGSTTGNTIGSGTGNNSIQVTNTISNATTIAMFSQSTSNGTFSNNTIGSITATGSATFSNSFRGIVKSSTNNLTVSNNTIGSLLTTNSIQANSSSTSATGQSVIGINAAGLGTLTASNNTICNLNNNYAGTDIAGQVIGIKSTLGVNNFTNNTIYNLTTSSKNPGTDVSASAIGISMTSTTAGQTIASNNIHNITNSSATAIVHVYGLGYQGPSTGTNNINNNIVHTLTLSSSNTGANIVGFRINGGSSSIFNNIIVLGTSVATGYVIQGIFEGGAAGNNNNIYFNTVYLGGTPASGSNTAALFSNANTNTRNFRDNIFDNSRSGGGNHYAAYFNYATAGSLTLNYNDYYAPGTGGKLGFFNSANVLVLPLIAANDANSLSTNPVFFNAGGINGSDYIPGTVLNGITIAGITTDYLSIVRGATPVMGALESSCILPASPTNTTPAANLTICNNASTALTATGTSVLGWYTAASGGIYLGGGGTYTTPALSFNTTFYVQDSTCAAGTRTAILVTVNSAIVVTSSQTDITCNAANNGTATVLVSGGTSPYTYAWTPSGGTAATASALSPGTYTCTINDASGCTATATFNITQPAAITGTRVITNVTCFGGSDGSVTVSPVGGTPPYTYLWAPLGGTSATTTPLPAGSYTCTITDANGCSVNRTCLITQPSPIFASQAQTDVSCNGGSNGSATVIASSGVAPYTYVWTPSGGTSATASSLTAGNYTCTITDANSCSIQSTFTITEPLPVSAAASQTNISCNGGSNGTATVVASGGTSPYTYSWAPSGGTSATATGLGLGSYTCTITDAIGCTGNQTFAITQPAALTATSSHVNISCFGGSNGSGTVIPSGGTAPYSYSWAPSGGNAATETGLITGSYTCTITDANSCTTTQTITITQPTALTVTTSQVNNTCSVANGSATVTPSGGTPSYTYSWSPSGGTAATASSLVNGNYTCTITDANSCATTATFAITSPALLAAVVTQTNVSCNGSSTGAASLFISGGTPGYTYSWAPTGGTGSTALSLSAGNYTCTITDAASCILTQTVTITEPTALVATTSQTNATCASASNGSATVSVSGGTPAYTYAWAPSGGTAATASSLAPGSYTCTITDANACTLTKTFLITGASAITIVASQTNLTCFGGNNGTATVVVSGGTPAYTYAWLPSGGTAATASLLTAGNYTCTITDANTCTATQTFNITAPAAILFTSSQTDVLCSGSNTGSATVVASGGASPYTYSWAPSGGTAATASSLAAGNYTCTITDANSCSTTATFAITQPVLPLSAASIQTNPTCSSSSNGSIDLFVSNGTPAYSYAWSPYGGTSSSATSLAAGSFTCIITDANGCSTTATFVLVAPVGMAVTASQTNVTCNGNADGTATVNVTGGTPGYTYSWAPSGGTAATAGPLNFGSYTCTITDANSCTTTQTFLITEPSALFASVSQVNNVCNGGNTGSATVNIFGGTLPYSYAWSPSGGNAATASSLTAGSYTCTITDANGCTRVQVFNITEPAPMTIVASQTNILCSGGSNGNASVVVSGGNSPYTYSWSPSGGTASSATSLIAGNYTCTITDAIGCTISQTFSITEPLPLAATTSQTNTTCASSANGTATVVVSGGTPSYTYAWTPSGGNAATASSLAAGTYTCTITDANGCILTKTFTITGSLGITLTASQTNNLCNGGASGTATVVVSGGTAPFTYAWSPSGGTAATASSLVAGTYTCNVSDAVGCTASQTFTITAPSALTSVSSQTNISCFGGNNGTATVVISGGTSPYTYTWTPSGGTTAIASSLSIGTYTCTITDNNGCTLTQSFSITQPPVLSFVRTRINVSCFGGNDGSGTVVISGGTAPYTYLWSPSGGTAATASNLTAGSYTCTVTDANGCTTTPSFLITQPAAAITATSSQTNVSCNGGANGFAVVLASGGTPLYSYSWAPTGGNFASASSLAAGTYTCTISDTHGCTLPVAFTITEPTPITATTSQTNVSCSSGTDGTATVSPSGGTPGYTYSWSPSGGTAATATSLAPASYTCTITDANGCILTKTFLIIQPPLLTTSISQTDVLCFGNSTGSATVAAVGGTPAYTYSWSPIGGNAATASGLGAGSYTCTITDANGCFGNQSITITQPTAIVVSANQTDVTCFGGNNGDASVIASGGTPGYTYSWSPLGQTAASISSLTAGNYSCTVSDAFGCTLTQAFNITEPPVLSATVTPTSVSCQGGSNGSALIHVTGGTLNYTYDWTPIGGTDSIATGLSAGIYNCTVTDANGCTISDIATIAEPSPINVSQSHTNVLCFGNTTGSATVSVFGGTPAYTYAWSPSGGSAATASGLGAGTYTCLITDAAGCNYSQPITIASPSAISSSTIITNVSCNGGSNGSATVIANGGTPFYTYNWSPSGGTGFTASSLSIGTYTCNITDANGCTQTQTAIITEPTVITAVTSSTNTNCGQNNGTASIVASGGITPYTYNWSPSGGTGSTATSILAGTYTCTVTDANTCSSSFTVTVNDTPAPTLTYVSQTNISCNGGNNGSATMLASGGQPGYTYSWTPSGGTAATGTSLTAGTYTCTVTDIAGCTQTQTATITQPTLLTATSTSGTILCNGGSTTATVIASGGTSPYTGEGTFPEVAGTYSFTITDANGCSATTSVTITQPTDMVVSAIPASILCNGAATSVSVNATGGTSPYTGTGPFVEFAGTYTFPVSDANGCLDSVSVTLTEPAVLTSASTATSILCNGGLSSISVTANGGTLPYTGVGSFSQPAGTYNYPITDANGCATSTSITITQPTLLVSVVDSSSNPTGCSINDGTVYISVSGGTSGYTYSWTNSSTTEDITGLSAGIYSCIITDANGCTSVSADTLYNPAAPFVSAIIDTTLCVSNAPYTLTEGSPAGGIWSGTAISGNNFDPAAAGIGSYVLTYSYTAANGCSSVASDTILVDACIGIEDPQTNSSWSVYPNPTYGELILSNPNGSNKASLVEIYSAEGKLIASEKFEAGHEIRLNITSEAAGIYLVRIISGSDTSTLHVIKQ